MAVTIKSQAFTVKTSMQEALEQALAQTAVITPIEPVTIALKATTPEPKADVTDVLAKTPSVAEPVMPVRPEIEVRGFEWSDVKSEPAPAKAKPVYPEIEARGFEWAVPVVEVAPVPVKAVYPEIEMRSFEWSSVISKAQPEPEVVIDYPKIEVRGFDWPVAV